MASTLTDTALRHALAGRLLLDHPFYRRWQEGLLEPGELTRYAEQYRHVEAELPTALGAIVEALPDGEAKSLVLANLADEQSHPCAHTELFESFAGAVGSEPGAAPTAATSALVEAYRSAAAAGPLEGLALLAAYESQAAAIASSKGEGLRDHYGLDGPATVFWDVHAALEEDHASWTIEAIALTRQADGSDDSAVAHSMRRGAEAWWAFLDEREAEHVAA